MSKINSGFSGLYLGLILVFLYIPIIMMMIMSFNQSELYLLPFQFDLVWYRRLAQNDQLIDAALNSIGIALANMVIASVLGTLTALCFARYEFRGKRVLQAMLLPTLTMPWLITGTAMLIFFFWSGIGRGLHSILLGHVALSIPYVVIIVGARLRSLGISMEEAAATLGANAWQIFWRITAPLMAPGIVAASLFAFAISFDQFVISYFLAPVGTSTLPVQIYSAIRKGFTPEINAISTIIILASMALMIGFARLSKFGGER